MKLIEYTPNYLMPNHKDFATLDEAIEAVKQWKEKTKAGTVVGCPKCEALYHTNVVDLHIITACDNDPYNPRDITIDRYIVCKECTTKLNTSLPSSIFKSVLKKEQR